MWRTSHYDALALCPSAEGARWLNTVSSWGGPSLASAQRLDGRVVSSMGFPRWPLMAESLVASLVSPGRDCFEGTDCFVSPDSTCQRVRCPGGPLGLSSPKEEEKVANAWRNHIKGMCGCKKYCDFDHVQRCARPTRKGIAKKGENASSSMSTRPSDATVHGKKAISLDVQRPFMPSGHSARRS